MPMIHDPAARTALKTRVQALTPTAQRKWGKMTVDQMLWHVNEAMDQALGRRTFTPMKMPMPRSIMRFMVFNVPWPKGTPTAAELVATHQYSFDAERARCLALVDELAARDMGGTWPDSAFLGPMSGRDFSRLLAKHLDHHLKQFSA